MREEIAKQELKKVPKHVGDGIGFETQADVTNADVGEIADVPGTLAFEECVVPTAEWLFLVMNGQKPLSLFTMYFLGARWTSAGLGSEKLAKIIYKALKAWPSSAGYHYQILPR